MMDTACKRARVWFPHKVINNIILHRWTRWKKAEFPQGNSIKRQQFCECRRERTWIRARDWHGAFLINIYWMEKKVLKKFRIVTSKASEDAKNSPPHGSNLRQLSVGKEFFNYLVFRLSTLNLTIHFAAELLPLAWRGGMGGERKLFVRVSMSKSSLERKTSEKSQKQQRGEIFAHVDVSVMLFLAADWNETRCTEFADEKIRSNEPISSLTSSQMGENLLMEIFSFSFRIARILTRREDWEDGDWSAGG